MDQLKAVEHFKRFMQEGLGLDLSDPNLSETPQRVAKMFCEELLCNCSSEFDGFKTFPNDRGYDQIICSDIISFVSLCAHHFLPFTGHAWIFYIPRDRLVGTSKMVRLVNHYSCRPQLQENLAHDIAERFESIIFPRGVMVFLRAIHGCMKCRGVKQQSGSGMMTSVVRGDFLDDVSLEQKGLAMVRISLLDRGQQW